MGPVFSFRWVAKERGPIPFPEPPLYVLSDDMESYSVGLLNSLPYGVSFNNVGTGVWGVVNVTGRSTALFYIVDSYVADVINVYQTGTVYTLTGISGFGTQFSTTTGIIYFGYDNYMNDMFELYPTGNRNIFSGINTGSAVFISSGRVISSGEL